MSNSLTERIFDELASGADRRATARRCGCCRNSVYARLRDDAFNERLAAEIEARKRARQAQRLGVQDAVQANVNDILNNPLTYPANARLKACELALRYLI